jgi:ankyrin repeat protein
MESMLQSTQVSLASLARDGNTTKLKTKLWQSPLELNKIGEHGLTPLQEAVCQHHIATVELLCNNQNIDVNAYSKDGLTALHYAIANSTCTCNPGATCDSCQILTLILNTQKINVDLPLYSNGSKSAIPRFIGWIRPSAGEGETALHIAALNGNEHAIKLLLAKGACTNKLTSRYESTLHFAVSEHTRTQDTIKRIIQMLYKNHVNINGKDCLGYTPLHILISSQPDTQADDTDIAQYLLDLGADINNKSCGITPLMTAVKRNNFKMVSFLLRAGADVNATNSSGLTALDLAIHKQREKIKRILLAYKAHCTLRPQNKDEKFWRTNPVHAAAQYGDEEILQDLLQQDINHVLINSTTEDGSTPLHYAVQGKQTQMVENLLLHGASFKIQSTQGTPTELATQLNNPSLVTILEHGNIDDIVSEHSQASPYDQQGATEIPIAGVAPTLPIRGLLVTSLQQTRQNESSTEYCGYYALYNALSFIQSNVEQRLNRANFADFFKNTLSIIREYRGHIPLDNLTSKEIRSIINQKFAHLPVIVIEQNDILARSSNLIKTLDEAFDHDSHTQNFLAKFQTDSPERINKLAIVTGLNNHWTAMLFTRYPDNNISVTTADSLKQPADFSTTASIQTTIFPFYLALTTPFARWDVVFKPAMLHEIMPDTKSDNTILKHLRDLIAYTHALDSSLAIYLSENGVKQINTPDKLLVNLQITQLLNVSKATLYMLNGYKIKLEDLKFGHK